MGWRRNGSLDEYTDSRRCRGGRYIGSRWLLRRCHARRGSRWWSHGDPARCRWWRGYAEPKYCTWCRPGRAFGGTACRGRLNDPANLDEHGRRATWWPISRKTDTYASIEWPDSSADHDRLTASEQLDTGARLPEHGATGLWRVMVG
jgi:hypothetical protein